MTKLLSTILAKWISTDFSEKEENDKTTESLGIFVSNGKRRSSRLNDKDKSTIEEIEDPPKRLNKSKTEVGVTKDLKSHLNEPKVLEEDSDVKIEINDVRRMVKKAIARNRLTSWIFLFLSI